MAGNQSGLSDQVRELEEELREARQTIQDLTEQMENLGKLTMDITEAAETLNISRGSLYNLIHSENFPTLKVGNRRLVSRELLAEWVRRNAWPAAWGAMPDTKARNPPSGNTRRKQIKFSTEGAQYI